MFQDVYANGFGYGYSQLILDAALYTAGTFGLGVLVRAGGERWWFGALEDAGHDAQPLMLLTIGVWGLVGLCIAIAVFAMLSWYLRGVARPVAVHMVVIGVGIVVALVVLKWLRGWMRMLPLGVSLGLIALVVDSGMNDPSRVSRASDGRAWSAPRCLMLGETLHAPRNLQDLMAMRMGKATAGPWVILLLIGRDDEQRRYRWSFTGIGFYKTYEQMPETWCEPHLGPLLAPKQLP
ncbi:MAG: hypothetical protein L0H65_02830 [Pseudorhodobacter sp.]|nr:hypothetical protein [Pseudorhodobacter sp.]